MNNILSIAQVLISIVLILLVILQEPSSGLGGLFGGSGEDLYHRRRGLSKSLFWATLILVSIFSLISLWIFLSQ